MAARTKIAQDLTAYPRRTGKGRIGEHALAALETFSNAGLASCHPATVEIGIRELRALVRVARAVGRVKGKAYTDGWEKGMEAVFHAHDALARVSGRGSRRARRG